MRLFLSDYQARNSVNLSVY